MKKIITALTVTAMALSAAFADVTLEFTQHAVLLGDNGNLDFNGYSGKFFGDSVGNGTADGNLKFQMKTADAGVWLTVKPTLQDKYTVTKSKTPSDIGKEKGGNAVKASEYGGWTKFFDGAMELRAGIWEARTANRFTSLAGKIQGTQYERYKMGTIGYYKFATDETVAGPATDVNRLTDKELAAQVQYKMDGGAWVTAVLKDSDYDSTSGIGQKAGIAAEFGTSLGEGSKLIVDFKNFKKDQYAVAAFFENSTFKEGLNFVTGFSFGRSDATTKTNNFEWAIDFRGTYELADNLLLTTMNNLTYDGINVKGTEPQIRLWDMVSLSTVVTEQITALFTVHWEHSDLLEDSESTAAGAALDLVPMVKYQVGKGVDLTGGISMRTSNWANRRPTTMTFEIPFVLHVSM